MFAIKSAPLTQGVNSLCSQEPCWPLLITDMEISGIRDRGREARIIIWVNASRQKNVPFSISNKEIKRNPLLLVINERLSQVRLACCNVFLTATVLHQYFQASLTWNLWMEKWVHYSFHKGLQLPCKSESCILAVRADASSKEGWSFEDAKDLVN